jgi:wyosine [tRNA(Phe)-imidazoG37] synthetase (radical SAM superfamily)
VAVITNGSLLWRIDVRRDLEKADLVVPSLDAVSEDTFQRINRPAKGLDAKKVIEGLRLFCGEFSGSVWLEVVLVDGINDSDHEIQEIRAVINSLDIDKIHLNTAVRPPAERWVKAVPKERMYDIKGILGDRAEVIADYSREIPKIYGAAESEILNMLKRRPVTISDISESLAISIDQVRDRLTSMMRRGIIQEREYEGKRYFLPK